MTIHVSCKFCSPTWCARSRILTLGKSSTLYHLLHGGLSTCRWESVRSPPSTSRFSKTHYTPYDGQQWKPNCLCTLLVTISRMLTLCKSSTLYHLLHGGLSTCRWESVRSPPSIARFSESLYTPRQWKPNCLDNLFVAWKLFSWLLVQMLWRWVCSPRYYINTSSLQPFVLAFCFINELNPTFVISFLEEWKFEESFEAELGEFFFHRECHSVTCNETYKMKDGSLLMIRLLCENGWNTNFKHGRVVEWMELPLSNMVRAVWWMEYSFQTQKGSGMDGTATVKYGKGCVMDGILISNMEG